MSKKTSRTTAGKKAPKKKKLALGRGLDALIPRKETPASARESNAYFECELHLLQPNPFQPRVAFEQEELEELADSIRTQGVIQPLVVREHENGYELVAGERRLRAARLAGLATVPVVVKKISDADMIEMSIVENIQRENLNPIEEAEAYHRLITEFDLTQDQAAARVGKSRPAVANMLRLRNLPEPIRQSIVERQISMGHARALLGAETSGQQTAAWRKTVAKKLSVRETELLVKRLKAAPQPKPPARPDSESVYYRSLADELARRFGTKVEIRRSGKRGAVSIEFYNDDDLERLLGICCRDSS
jgi:ParB family chromosome partitioning protein